MEGGHNMAYLYQLNIVINDVKENFEIEANIEKAIACDLHCGEYVEIVSARIIELDSNVCGRCQKCGAWTTDKSKKEYIDEFSDGDYENGHWLCDICLPKNHLKSF